MKYRQQTIAALLAVGAPVNEIANRLGVSVSYINVLLKGDLFQNEIVEQRKLLVGERLEEYAKLVSEQLVPNLKRLIEMRDNPEAPPAARLRAIELINDALVPKARPKGSDATTQVRVVLTPEQNKLIDASVREDGLVRADRE